MVDARGRVGYAMDASGRIVRRGAFAHGRAAAVIRALAAHHHDVSTARSWLAGEIDAALAGESIADWPDDASQIAGTLALATLAGIDRRALLEAAARNVTSSWHAAQCVVALGRDSRIARRSFRLCISDLSAHPFAPWTAIAARTLGDDDVLHRCARSLAGSIGPDGGVGSVPEVALTAITVQALAPTDPCRPSRAFLRRNQVRARGPLYGAFPASPATAYFRADITAHALLALLA